MISALTAGTDGFTAGTDGLILSFFLDELLELELDELFFLPDIAGALTSGLFMTGALTSALISALTAGIDGFTAGTDGLILAFFLDELLELLELDELFFLPDIAGTFTSGLLITGALISALISGLTAGTEGLIFTFLLDELLELELDELFFFPDIAGAFTSGLLMTGALTSALISALTAGTDGFTAGTDGLILSFFLDELLELELDELFFLPDIAGAFTSGLLMTGALISALISGLAAGTDGLTAGTDGLILSFFLDELLELLELDELFFLPDITGAFTSGLLMTGALTSAFISGLTAGTDGLTAGTDGLILSFFLDELLELLELDELFFLPDTAGALISGLLMTGALISAFISGFTAGTEGLIFIFFLLELLELELEELFFLPVIDGGLTSGLFTTGGLTSVFISGLTEGTEGFMLILFFEELLELLELDELFFFPDITGAFTSGLLMTGALTSGLFITGVFTSAFISGLTEGTEGFMFSFFLLELLELELEELFFFPPIAGGLTSGLFMTGGFTSALISGFTEGIDGLMFNFFLEELLELELDELFFFPLIEGGLMSGLLTTGGFTSALILGFKFIFFLEELLELDELEELFFFPVIEGGFTSGLLTTGGFTSALISGLTAGTDGLMLIFFLLEELELELEELFFLPTIFGVFISGLLITGGLTSPLISGFTAGMDGFIFNFFLLELLELELDEFFFLLVIDGGLISGLFTTGGLTSALI